MYHGQSCGFEFAGLHYGPFDSRLPYLFGGFAAGYLLYERLRNIDMECLRQYGQVFGRAERLDARDYRYCDAGLAAQVDERENLGVVEAELCYDITRPRIHLAAQIGDVGLHVGRFGMFFWISGHSDAEVRAVVVLGLVV